MDHISHQLKAPKNRDTASGLGQYLPFNKMKMTDLNVSKGSSTVYRLDQSAISGESKQRFYKIKTPRKDKSIEEVKKSSPPKNEAGIPK